MSKLTHDSNWKSITLPKDIFDAVQKEITKTHLHLSVSDFVRDAIREKLDT